MTKIDSASTFTSAVDDDMTTEPVAPRSHSQRPQKERGDSLESWTASAAHWLDAKSETLEGQTKSAALSCIEFLGLKEKSPVSTDLLKHYVEGSGTTYALRDVDPEWQKWIVKETHGKTGTFKNLNPYNSGLHDLRHSLGHFDVTVTKNKDGAKTYTIQDTYKFGFIKNDTAQQGRHGFSIGERGPIQLALINAVLPKEEYQNPGGFKERWEVKTVGKENILFIPQEFLAKEGKPFKVTGTFTTR